MINNKALRKAYEIFEESGLDNISLSIDNKQVDIKLLSGLINMSNEETSVDNRPVFIEFDIDKTPRSIYIWIWTCLHPQYDWILKTVNNEFEQGIFRVSPEGLEYFGSIY